MLSIFSLLQLYYYFSFLFRFCRFPLQIAFFFPVLFDDVSCFPLLFDYVSVFVLDYSSYFSPRILIFLWALFMRGSIYECTFVQFYFLTRFFRSNHKKAHPAPRAIIPCSCRASTTAQHSASQSAMHEAAKHVRADQNATTEQADRVGESQHVVEHLYSSLCCQHPRTNRNLPGKKHTHNHKKLVMREGFAFSCFQSQYHTIQRYSCSFVQIDVYDACVRNRGRFPGAWSSWHLQVVSWHLINDMCPLHSHCLRSSILHIFLYFFFVSERSRRKPPAERSALCSLILF